jgi:hypothetical protein
MNNKATKKRSCFRTGTFGIATDGTEFSDDWEGALDRTANAPSTSSGLKREVG